MFFLFGRHLFTLSFLTARWTSAFAHAPPLLQRTAICDATAAAAATASRDRERTEGAHERGDEKGAAAQCLSRTTATAPGVAGAKRTDQSRGATQGRNRGVPQVRAGIQVGGTKAAAAAAATAATASSRCGGESSAYAGTETNAAGGATATTVTADTAATETAVAASDATVCFSTATATAGKS